MNKASVREIMLQHEKTFKEQVQDLHKLYGKQKLLMAERIKGRGRDPYTGQPPPSLGGGNALMGEINLGERIKFWEPATPEGNGAVMKEVASIQTPNNLPKAITEWIVKVEEVPKNAGGPSRKRKIDLELPPEDDSEDEMESSFKMPNRPTPCRSGDLEEFPKLYSCFSANPQHPPGSSLQGSQLLASNMPHSTCASGEPKLEKASRLDAGARALPSLPANVTQIERVFPGFGEKNLCFFNSGMIKSSASPSKNNTMFLPQADLVDRASQEIGRQAHWIFQSPETSIVDTSVKFAAQQQQSPQFVPSEQSSSMCHTSSPNVSHRLISNKSVWTQPMNATTGNVNLNRQTPGISNGSQKDTLITSVERLGDASKWFLKESCAQGASLTNMVPMGRCEYGILAEGGQTGAGVFPTVSKGLSQEQDACLWSSKIPALQLSQFQQPPFTQHQIAPTASQSLWMQSSQMAQNIYHQQQNVYNVHTSDPLQTGYGGELLPRNQGEVAGSWNMIGMGHYYPTIHSPPQKPPFVKPPKLVLKNDGIGMELKLVSPEKELSEKEKCMPKMPLTSVGIESLQCSSKYCEVQSVVQREPGQDDKVKERAITEEMASPEEQRRASSIEASENSTTHGLSTGVTLLSEAPSSCALTLSQDVAASVSLPPVAHCNDEAPTCMNGREISSPSHVSALPKTSVSALPKTNTTSEHAFQTEIVSPHSESEKLIETRIMTLKTSEVVFEKETLGPLSSVVKDMPAQPPRIDSPKAEMDVDSGAGNGQEKKKHFNKLRSLEAAVTGGITSFLSESLDATQQGGQSLRENETVANKMVKHKLESSKNEEVGLPESCADTVVHQRGLSSHNADSSHCADQLAMQAVSMQSTSTDTPCILREERRFMKDIDELQGVSMPLPCSHKNDSGYPLPDRDCASTASPVTCMSYRKSEAVAGVSNDELQHDSDSDNLAASILLSFAPKLDPSCENKQPMDTASEISSTKAKPDQGSKSSRSSEDRVGTQSDHWNSASSRGRRLQNVGTAGRVDGADNHRTSKVTIKDRQRRDAVNSLERQSSGGNVVTKNFTIKLPRVAGSTFNSDSIPVSRSKQLSKLNGVSMSENPVESVKMSHKNVDGIHTPTGRRSSRGPILGSRGSLESRNRLHQQTQHLVDCYPPSLGKDSTVREEDVCSVNKLEESMKSKAWGELNRTRSHPRKQGFETAHRKSQE